MAYSDFSLSRVQENFGLTIHEVNNLFAKIKPIEASDYLQVTLAETVPLALAINTEKARSELMITPLLLEIRRKLNNQISLFSGTEFTVDAELGLNGYCDFIISQSTEQLFIKSPVAIIIEAKNENIKAGFGQCIAAMVAAQLFNRNQGKPIQVIYGAVTTGDIWRFLQLREKELELDLSNFYLDQTEKILGILYQMFQQPKVNLT